MSNQAAGSEREAHHAHPAPKIYKDREASADSVLPSGLNVAQSMATGFGGTAEAFAAAFDELRKNMTEHNLTRLGPDNGVFAGSVAASARFFEELAHVFRRSYDELRRVPPPPPPPEIDYERLATLVAQKLREPK